MLPLLGILLCYSAYHEDDTAASLLGGNGVNDALSIVLDWPPKCMYLTN